MPEETTNVGVVKLNIAGDTFELKFDDLELGEIGVIEELCDRSMRDIDFESARGIQGLVWVAMHRKNPQFTIADAGRIKFSAIQDAVTDESADAAKGKAERPTKAA